MSTVVPAPQLRVSGLRGRGGRQPVGPRKCSGAMRGGATRRAEDGEEVALANRQRRKSGWTWEEVAARTTRKKGRGSHISTNYVGRGLNSRPYNSDAMLEWSY
jgi:hypothetical protein